MAAYIAPELGTTAINCLNGDLATAKSSPNSRNFGPDADIASVGVGGNDQMCYFPAKDFDLGINWISNDRLTIYNIIVPSKMTPVLKGILTDVRNGAGGFAANRIYMGRCPKVGG